MPSQGTFDAAYRDHGSLFRYQGRFGLLYDVRGVKDGDEPFIGMSLAWSDDMRTWRPDDRNPCLPGKIGWIRETCKDPHVLYHDGAYLIYYATSDADGYRCVGLATTRDWRNFSDEGCVFRVAPALRGTLGIESPCVVLRDGIWHLFFTYGPGTCHTISRSPRDFVSAREGEWQVGKGFYYLGPFHAAEVFQHDDQWWLTTTRKEEIRRLNRLAGRLCFRGTYEDEKALEAGLFAARLNWKGDQPVLEKPQ